MPGMRWIRHWGKYQVAVVWNWPTAALWSWDLWRYTPEMDSRVFFLLWRVGPWKIEVVKQR